MSKNKTKKSTVDFQNTQIAFKSKSDAQLSKMAFLFSMMNKPFFVKMGAIFGPTALKWNLPFARSIAKNTIFEQFCGGTSLLNSKKSIEELYKNDIFTMLDYGAEGKQSERDFNATMVENMKAIDFAALNPSVSVVTTKISGLAKFELLERLQSGDQKLNSADKKAYKNILKRLDAICHKAAENNIKLFIDAEESWIQDTIDYLVRMMMKRYNKQQPIVYNTIQLYRHDRLQFLKDSYELAKKEGYHLAVKLVRGAYMEKERERARTMIYPSPIQLNKANTDRDFNEALLFCLKNYETIASCCASHNAESNKLQADYIEANDISTNHPNLMFSQLYGMGDYLTFNLAEQGFYAAKYVPYGKLNEVIPYLIRRAKENTSVTGDMSREFKLIQSEVNRRKKA